MKHVYKCRSLVLITTIVIGLLHTRAHATSVDIAKQKATERLKARKKGFDQHLKNQKIWEEKRALRAQEIKKVRKERKARTEKARRNFRREEQTQPVDAYNKFVKKRQKEELEVEKARRDHQVVEQQLRSIRRDKRYLINGRKEFDLD